MPKSQTLRVLLATLLFAASYGGSETHADVASTTTRFALLSLDRSAIPIRVRFSVTPPSPVTEPPPSAAPSLAPDPVPSAIVESQAPGARRLRKFWIFGRSQIVARHVASSRHADIWADDVPELATIDSSRVARAAEIAFKSDVPRFGSIAYRQEDIASNEVRYCSSDFRVAGSGPRIVDGNTGRLTVLIAPFANDVDYADTLSYMPQAELNCYSGHFMSNETPGIVLVEFDSSLPAAGASYRRLPLQLAHEIQHLENFTRHVITANRTEDSFIDEGLSQLAEDYAASELEPTVSYAEENEQHVRSFLADPEGTSLFGFDTTVPVSEYNAGSRQYGAAYLLQRYLVDRFGDDYLTSMSRSTKVGIDELNAVTGRDFVTIASDFAKAVGNDSCRARTVFCDIVTSARSHGSSPPFRTAHAGDTVSIVGGSLSFWQIRSNQPPLISTSPGAHIILIPLIRAGQF
jgi:hypothetical protein